MNQIVKLKYDFLFNIFMISLKVIKTSTIENSSNLKCKSAISYDATHNQHLSVITSKQSQE